MLRLLKVSAVGLAAPRKSEMSGDGGWEGRSLLRCFSYSSVSVVYCGLVPKSAYRRMTHWKCMLGVVAHQQHRVVCSGGFMGAGRKRSVILTKSDCLPQWVRIYFTFTTCTCGRAHSCYASAIVHVFPCIFGVLNAASTRWHVRTKPSLSIWFVSHAVMCRDFMLSER